MPKPRRYRRFSSSPARPAALCCKRNPPKPCRWSPSAESAETVSADRHTRDDPPRATFFSELLWRASPHLHRAETCSFPSLQRSHPSGRPHFVAFHLPSSHRHALRRAGVPAGLFDFSASFRFTVHPYEEVKTLGLQVRFAHPPNGEASHRHALRRAGVPAGLFDFSASFRFTVHPCEEVKTLGLQVCFAHPPNGEALPRPLRFSKYTSALFYSLYGTLR